MPVEDIYTPENLARDHSLRFIHITARNVVGILNRIASLMRRKRYNMEEVSVAFDEQDFAHITIAVDGRLIDVQQLMEQILKLHDVINVCDATDQKDKLYNAIYVRASSLEDLKDLPYSAARVFEEKGGIGAVFIVPFHESSQCIELIKAKKLSFVRRVLSILSS